MSKFYGTLQGHARTGPANGQATRRGHTAIEAVAASWDGAVKTTMYEGEGGATWVRIETVAWEGHGRHNLVYEGPLAPMFTADTTRPLYAQGAAA